MSPPQLLIDCPRSVCLFGISRGRKINTNKHEEREDVRERGKRNNIEKERGKRNNIEKEKGKVREKRTKKRRRESERDK